MSVAPKTSPRRTAETHSTTILWKQAFQFENCGGWTPDCQFMDQMGSSYLLATGIGDPVEDAVTRVEIPQSGSYRLWVRCKDWYPSHSPGLFQVMINGVASKTLFGKADDADWKWSDGGCFDLAASEVELRLHDLTGWWSRCDAIVLCLDGEFRPSDDLETLRQHQETFGAMSRTVEQPEPFDVVVIGGGLAGVAAAVTAARHGCRVALLQDRPVFGGNTSAEIQVTALGDETRQPWDPRETGLIEEFDPKLTGKSGWSANLEDFVQAESRVEVFRNLRSSTVQMGIDKTIKTVEGIDTQTMRRYRFTGRLFIDCTGDAIIGHAAGADYRHGREARSEFNESLAPEVADQRTMGNTLYAGQVVNSKESVPFETPPWAYQWTCVEDFERRPTAGVWSNGKLPAHFTNLEKGGGRPPDNALGPVGCWYAEAGGMMDTIADAEAIRDELFRIDIGLWGYVKNHDPNYREANAKRKLAALNPIAGKRESRRLLGDYVLTQSDYADNIIHSDTIAYGGWTIDDHHPQGYFAPGPLAYHAYLQKVSIPYRCLYSRNISNLMMAGRNLSATHVGFGGVRVMRTCSLMGQAAGTAAAIAMREETSPRGVYVNHIPELQQTLLKDGAYLLGVANEDQRDLARAAQVTASSFAVGNDPSWVTTPVSGWGVVHRLDTTRAVMFRAPEDRIEEVSLRLRSRNETETRIGLTLRGANELGDFSSTEDLAVAEAVVPPKSSGWVSFPLSAVTKGGDYYYIELPKTEGIEWELYSYHPPETLRGYDGPGWGALWGCYKFSLTPGGEPPASAYAAAHDRYEFHPENIINGWNRAVEGAPNAWAPDPALPLPQHIELSYSTPIQFNTMHVVFQLASLAPSRYSIVVRQGGEWRSILQVDKNHARRQVHVFDTIETDAVRLIIEKAPERAKSPLTGVCEIRLYQENTSAVRRSDPEKGNEQKA